MQDRSPVEFGNGVGRRLPDVRRHIGGGLFDGQHHNGDDDGDSDAGENSQSTGSDQLVGILMKRRNKERITHDLRLAGVGWLTEVFVTKCE